MAQIFAGLMAEGTTDLRFLQPIIERTLTQVAFDCKGQIDIDLTILNIDKTGKTFLEQVKEALEKGKNGFSMMMLCVHADADNDSANETYQNKILPAQKLVVELENDYCKVLVAIVPIPETEAWMLADKELFKTIIGTDKSNIDLDIHKHPEKITNPKKTIQDAIRIARENLVKKRRGNLTITDLYLPIGQR
jgi:hypothetical protein